MYKVTAKSLNEIITGAWYYGVKCHKCQKRVMIFDAHPTNKVTFAGSGAAPLLVTCPHCRAKGTYPVDLLDRFQAE